MTDLVMGVDVGGTTVKAALLDSDGREYGRCVQTTPRDVGPEAIVATIVDTVVELRNHAPEAGRLRAVGLVVPGVVDAQHGIAVYASNLGWQDLPIRQMVAEAVGLPVILDHDVRAAGLAELELGAGRGSHEMLFVALGTGIAAAVITRGQLATGATGMAGELGHLPVFPDGEWCACGQRGCTETYASGAALSRRYSAVSGISGVTAKDVLSRASAGDDLAHRRRQFWRARSWQKSHTSLVPRVGYPMRRADRGHIFHALLFHLRTGASNPMAG